MENKGFTLIELIITLFLIMLVLTLSIPKISIDFGYMERMANEFILDVRYLQMQSMKHPSLKYNLCIFEKQGYYYLRKNLTIEKKVIFNERYKIDYNGTTDPILFTYEGAPINAGTLCITDTKTNETISVSIVPTTGRTLIKE